MRHRCVQLLRYRRAAEVGDDEATETDEHHDRLGVAAILRPVEVEQDRQVPELAEPVRDGLQQVEAAVAEAAE